MPFRKRYLRERCAKCSCFLHHQGQKEMGICVDCAKKELEKIIDSRRIRTLIGLVLASMFFALLLSLNANNFDNALTELSIGVQALAIFGCFLFPFARFVSLDDLLPMSTNSFFGGNDGCTAVIEFLISAFTGPIFFVHGLFKIQRLSNYINNPSHNDCLEDL